MRRRRVLKKTRIVRMMTILLIIMLIFTGCYYCLCALVPNIRALSINRARQIATFTVNDAIVKKFENEKIDYDSIVKFTYSDDGKIRAVSNNISSVNTLKSELVQDITKAIADIDTSEISLPLGSLTGIDFLYGTGPYLPVSIKPYGYAVADIVTDFRSSGINQTIFEVTAKVSANVSVLMPLLKSSEKIETSVPVISTVIVGDVPGSYTNVERYGEEYEEDVLQLAE